jgi:8-oxo-dGTP pyrophosphatase MutT (NUDIX family)
VKTACAFSRPACDATVSHVTDRMASDLLAALARELTVRSRTTLAPSDKTAAAVLVPLLAVDGALHLLFTRRAATMPHHQGQVAFPGGTRRPGDADAEETALREANEEIGLQPRDVRVLGRLDDIETVASRFHITPVVGVAPHPYEWRPCPREVDAIFTVPVAELAARTAEREELWDFGGRQIPIRLFAVAGEIIWGATHRITRNLLDLLGQARDGATATGTRLA